MVNDLDVAAERVVIVQGQAEARGCNVAGVCFYANDVRSGDRDLVFVDLLQNTPHGFGRTACTHDTMNYRAGRSKQFRQKMDTDEARGTCEEDMVRVTQSFGVEGPRKGDIFGKDDVLPEHIYRSVVGHLAGRLLPEPDLSGQLL